MKAPFRIVCAFATAALLSTPAALSAKKKPPAMVEFDRIPDDIIARMTDPTKAIGYPGLAWGRPNLPTTVTVAFNGGTPQAWALIERTANEWTANGGRLSLSFRFPNGQWRTWRETDTTAAAQIRIGFFTDAQRRGYWSSVGVLATRIYPNAPTMNFGALGTSLTMYDAVARPAAWQGSYAHSVILHEFGHALGLAHEHFHPKCQADMRLTEAIRSLQGPPNSWTEQQARYNMEASYYFNVMAGQSGGQPVSMTPNSDRASVMLYSFDNRFYGSGGNSPCKPLGTVGYATALSAQDRAYYAGVYGGV